MKPSDIQTQEHIAAKAPACFGAISCFSRDSEYCKRCEAFEACEQKSYQTLMAIKEVVNVNDLLKQHQKAQMAQEAKRRELREEMNAPRSINTGGGLKPKKPTLVERATKVEKVTFEPTKDQEELIVRLPVKAQSFALTLIKNGLVAEIKKGLANKQNALDGKKPAWLSLAIEALLQGGFTRSQLKGILMDKLEWKDNTSQSHVSLAVVLLIAFGIAVEHEAKIVLA